MHHHHVYYARVELCTMVAQWPMQVWTGRVLMIISTPFSFDCAGLCAMFDLCRSFPVRLFYCLLISIYPVAERGVLSAICTLFN